MALNHTIFYLKLLRPNAPKNLCKGTNIFLFVQVFSLQKERLFCLCQYLLRFQQVKLFLPTL